jgi:hypothetical protein
MASSIYQRKKEDMISVHTSLTNEVNPLSSEEAHFVETCCHILGDRVPRQGGAKGCDTLEKS